MITWLTHLRIGGGLALGIYWLPLAICLVGYTLRTVRHYRQDVAVRAALDAAHPGEPGWYQPTDTIGTLIGRAAIAAVPCANLIVVIVDLGPHAIGAVIDWCGRAFAVPLVPRRKRADAASNH